MYLGTRYPILSQTSAYGETPNDEKGFRGIIVILFNAVRIRRGLNPFDYIFYRIKCSIIIYFW